MLPPVRALSARVARVAATTAVGVVALLALLVASAVTASAHVTIADPTLPAGATAVVRFVVPNESDSATTTKIEIGIPDDVLLPSVLPQTSGSWKATTETRTLANPVQTDDGQVSQVVSKITFDGGSIPVGQFQEFDLLVDSLPDKPGTSVAFPTVQTYSDGTIVRWIDPIVAGQPEPEHPTPVVELTAAEGSSSGSGSSSGPSGWEIAAIVLGAVGTVLGAAALVVGVRRRP